MMSGQTPLYVVTGTTGKVSKYNDPKTDNPYRFFLPRAETIEAFTEQVQHMWGSLKRRVLLSLFKNMHR